MVTKGNRFDILKNFRTGSGQTVCDLVWRTFKLLSEL